MTQQTDISAEDRTLFRQAVGTVQPLPQDRADPDGHPRPAPLPRFSRADERQVLADMLSDWIDPADWTSGEIIEFCRQGLQHSVLRKLRRGQFRVHGELDLHGMSVETARQALAAFLQRARRDSRTCVRIIHGKGNGSRHKGPVLKQKVDHWLRQREEVLAFCSARPVDGGSGAVYVLLRRS